MNLKKESLFYFDCEWVPVSETVEDLEKNYPKLYSAFSNQCEKWNKTNFEENKPQIEEETYYKIKGHFYPELCQIICVSYGFFNRGLFEIKSIYGNDEHQLLSSVAELFNKVSAKGLILSGYSIKRFDMPWLSKRMMANNIAPPKNLTMYGKKPWEVEVFDLPEVWGQGNIQESYTPFELACAAVGIESSKVELKGSEVADAFYKGEIEKIKTYCELDVLKTQELASKLIDLL
jgi:3'-5' exonuclease